MRSILHEDAFQALEPAPRVLQSRVRSLEIDGQIERHQFDAARGELVAAPAHGQLQRRAAPRRGQAQAPHQ
ncbi:MAG: hypothetical protein KGL18_17970 [Burkholderiales bacterium]|nr:hypothetical protein [Burkholderiales bacterium]MDE1927363.1 hypothetical protein [Burkholderiales bacterium]MDE2159004.1 hypothetical protein [Burkholderiales bacterium]MDE2504855.1 hypothetical protein [Burkholderiales bacterium]